MQNLSDLTIFIDSSVQNNIIDIDIYTPNISHFSIFLTIIASTNIFKIFSNGFLAINVALT